MHKHIIAICMCVCIIFTCATPSAFALEYDCYTKAYKSSKYYQQLLEVELTGDMRKDIVAIAMSQIGYHEGNYSSETNGYNRYGSGNYTEYNIGSGYWQGVEWCGIFVTWCARTAGVPTSILAKSASASPHSGYGYHFAGADKMVGSEFYGFQDLAVKKGDYIPQGGDIIFFAKGYSEADPNKRHSYSHVGLVADARVEYNENGNVCYMEIDVVDGNYGNAVDFRTYKIDTKSRGYAYKDVYIAAFGVPDYITKHHVTWNIDGVEYTEEAFKYDTPVCPVIPSKLSDAIYSYTFVGWDKDIVPVTGDVTYTAQFKAKEHAPLVTEWFKISNPWIALYVKYKQYPSDPLNKIWESQSAFPAHDDCEFIKIKLASANPFELFNNFDTFDIVFCKPHKMWVGYDVQHARQIDTIQETCAATT